MRRAVASRVSAISMRGSVHDAWWTLERPSNLYSEEVDLVCTICFVSPRPDVLAQCQRYMEMGRSALCTVRTVHINSHHVVIGMENRLEVQV
mmetsp:Transcript_605/g.1431  ORF Transcript_605/g.1431 Transcript_605/m.1431 type:complete len:92 (+) Transcript_605:625-900(+)